MKLRWLLIFTAFLACTAGCGGGDRSGRVIILGIDGLDPQVVDLLMSEGKLPHFARMRQEGAYGKLRSAKPLLSPVIWTTIATGKTPDQHGIGHFTAVNQQTGEQLPVTSQMRKVRALWNLCSEAGRTVDVVGWWATWPAETVNGKMISDHLCYHFLFEEGITGESEAAGRTYPEALADQLAPQVTRPGDLTLADTERFIQVSAEEFARPFDFQDDLGHFKWAYATAQSYRRIGLRLWEEDRPDLLLVYIEGVDSSSHLFGHLFRAGELAGELAAQQQRYGHTVEEMYRFADEIVGDFLNVLDDDTTLLVLSDHGFELGALPEDPSKLRDMRRVSERFHRIDGILYMFGNRVRPHSQIDGATILDITPTVLALQGMPGARDMPGRALTEALDLRELPPAVSTYETGTLQAGPAGGDSAVDPQILERLRSLGYIDASSPQGERNLAAVHFEAGRYAEAVAAYEELVAASPEDGALRASLAGAYGAMGEYDKALEQLTKAIELEPLNVEAYHNRGVLYERRGDAEAAIEEYRTALRYNPQYEPSRAALVRLTGSGEANAPQTDAEKLAALIAERASAAARRGDYAEAMKSLDEARRVAPGYALVYQYRANVAYLMGDRGAAIAALEQALELEPDNALFRENLKRLREQETETAPAS